MAGPLTRQAQAEAFVRYGPQRFALRELLAQAIQTKDQALRSARAAEQAIQHVISVARGETQQNYAAAGATTAGTREMVGQSLSALGAAASPFAAAIARERGGAQDRMAEGQASSLQELTSRRLEAASGRAYSESTARRTYGSDLGKIQRSYQELAGEEGAFTQGRIGELKKDAADRQFQRDLAEMRDVTTRRGQDITTTGQQETARHNRQTESTARTNARKRTAGNRPRSGVGSLTQGEENSIKDDINQVVSVITNPPAFEDAPKGSPPGTKGPRLTHQRMLAHLRNGTNPLGKPIPADLITIAYELRDTGVLSPNSVKLLHARGMHVPPEWLPKKRRQGGGYAGIQLPAPPR